MTYDIDALNLHLTNLIEWRIKHPRPSNRKHKHLRRWRKNRAHIKVYEALAAYTKTLGPDWFVAGEPQIITFDGNESDEDDFFLVVRRVELNRSSCPLPNGTVVGCDCGLTFQGNLYFISQQRQYRSFPTPEALAEAVLHKVVEHYGPSPT